MLPAHGPYDGLSVKPGWTKPTTGNQSAFVQLLHSTRPYSESGAYVYQIRLLFVPLWDDRTTTVFTYALRPLNYTDASSGDTST